MLMCFFMSFSAIASIIQQFNTMVNWVDVKTSQWENVVANVGRPELNITGASTGLDLVLFYMRSSPDFHSRGTKKVLVFWSRF